MPLNIPIPSVALPLIEETTDRMHPMWYRWFLDVQTTVLSGALLAANNLSDVASAATSRTNLGVPSTTGVGASGTWGINISGNAATATFATTAGSTLQARTLVDANLVTVVNTGTTASAVNNFIATNAIAGSSPTFAAEGTSTNIDINLQCKGTGVLNNLGTTTTAAELRLFEQTTNGTNYTGLKAATAITTNTTFTLPSAVPSNNNQITVSSTGGTLSFSPMFLPAAVASTNNSPLVGATTGALTYSPIQLPSVAPSSNNQAIVFSTAGAPTYTGVVRSVVQQVFTASGTYTPTSGMLYCTIDVQGGGGGGGGCSAGAAQLGVGGGGGGGSHSRSTVTAATIGASQAVTIGAAGTAGAAGAAGGTGGASSVGSIVTTNGGVGGAAQNNVPFALTVAAGGAGGAAGTGQVSLAGATGGYGPGWQVAGAFAGLGGNGAGTQYNTGGAGNFLGGGGAAVTNSGAGGGGGNCGASSSATGGAGGAGLVIITEYIG